MSNTHTLKNKHLVARFDTTTGKLVHLSPAGRGKGMVSESYCRYNLEKNGFYSNADGLAKTKVGGFEPTDIVCEDNAFGVKYVAEHVSVKLRFELPADSSLLTIHSETQGSVKDAPLAYFAVPGIRFADNFYDTFEDTEDLFFDGAELKDDRELPCWRVFFQKGHKTGLLLAARNKQQMGAFQIREDHFHLHPHVRPNYTDAFIGKFDLWTGSASRKTHRHTFEIGPWSKQKHKQILKAAKLEEPVEVKHPKPTGKPAKNLKGKLFYAVDFAAKSAVSKDYSRNKWMITEVPWAQKGKILFAGNDVQPPALKINPKLKGLHRVHVGIADSRGIRLKSTKDAELRIRIDLNVGGDESLGFISADAYRFGIHGKHKPNEVGFGVYDLTGQTFTLMRNPAMNSWSAIDYIRFEPLTKAEQAKYEKEQAATPIVPFSGLNDIPDIAPFTDPQDPDPRMYASNIMEHAKCKFEKIYWRIDGQCCDYQSKVNTMRYISAKVHNSYNPQAKAYGRVLKKTNILKVAVDAAKEHGVELWGWQRFNNYNGNVQSDFYKNNPKYRDEWENGNPHGKLCLAHKTVRDHKIDILVEAAKHGLDGLCLGFLRHPPTTLYAPKIVKAYEKKFGKLPPRDLNNPDPAYRNSLPPKSKEYQQWFQFRSQYMTKFGRELRARLKKEGLGHVKIAIWVRPNHCLLDGIDMPLWLNEGLCDEVVSGHYMGHMLHRPDLVWETPEWRKMVREKAKLIRELPIEINYAPKFAKKAIAEGVDGLCTYESDYTVIDDRFIEMYQSLCK